MSETTTGNPYRIYLVTWGILLVITVAMLAAESFHMPRWFLLAFLLAFMMVKAVMIGGNFMHLRHENVVLRWIVAAGLVVTSLILFFFIRPESKHILEKTTFKTTAPSPHPAE
jgi:caa(3)-type oxidase subunit IV